jgi:uncharacterized protein (TIGR03435 family)
MSNTLVDVKVGCKDKTVNLLLIGIALAAVSGSLRSQTTATESPKFEVASIKPSNPAERNHVYDLPHVLSGGQFISTSLPVRRLIQLAYGVEEISGGPGWVNSDLFDVAAKLNGLSTYPQFQLMLQSMLEERFRLHIRRDTKEMQCFSLVVASGGLRMKEVESASPRPRQGYRNGLFISTAIGIPALAANLALFVGRGVIDGRATIR